MTDADRTTSSAGPHLVDTGRLARYLVTGCLSTLAHVGTLTLLVETGLSAPVLASAVGFALSIVVSYTLQKSWVFGSQGRHRATLPRFLLATVVALLLNTTVLTIGTELASVHYLVAQAVALVLIPMSNYLINASWTFNPRHG